MTAPIPIFFFWLSARGKSECTKVFSRRHKLLINDRTHLTKLYIKTAHLFIYVTDEPPYDLGITSIRRFKT